MNIREAKDIITNTMAENELSVYLDDETTSSNRPEIIEFCKKQLGELKGFFAKKNNEAR